MMVLRMSIRISTALLIATSSSRPFIAAFTSFAPPVRTTALSRSLHHSSLAMASPSSVPASSEKRDAVAVASAARSLKLFIETPLIFSSSLTALTGSDRPVYLKLDVLQQSGSFKDRGVAHLCHTLKLKGVQSFVSSSGGNAGLAVACTGKLLGMQVQVIVPVTT